MKKITHNNNSLFIKVLALIISISIILLLQAIFEFNVIIMWGLLMGVILFFIKAMWKHFMN